MAKHGKKLHINKKFIISAVSVGIMLPLISQVAHATTIHKDSKPAVTSLRSFPKTIIPKRDLLTESISTDSDPNVKWGGLEKISVPQTKSAQEIAQEQAQAAAQRRAQQEAAYQAASRSAAREPLHRVPVQQQAITVAPPNGSDAQAVVSFASQFVGKVPYVYGGTTTSGWDCSGFVQYVFNHFGIQLPRVSGAQAGVGRAVPSLDQAQPGDILATGSHAAIYIGNGMAVNAENPGAGTRFTPVRYIFPYGCAIRRVL